MLKQLSTFWNCRIWHDHDWTSAVMEGEKPTRAQLETGVLGFWQYAEMYCKRCGRVSQLSINATRRALGLPDGFKVLDDKDA